MTVVAILHSGQERTLAADLGATPEDVIAGLTQASLTGSAYPFNTAWLATEDGGLLNYSAVAEFRQADE